MANKLPLDERLGTAGQLVVRARIFFDIWWLYSSHETRPRFIDAMNQYGGFFPFDEHAHLVSFIIHLVALLERKDDTINLSQLVGEIRDSGQLSQTDMTAVDALLAETDPYRKKLAILRNNVIAHRSASLSYDAAFEKAEVTPNELRELTEKARHIVNRLLLARGLKEQFVWQPAVDDARALFRTLIQHPRDNWAEVNVDS